MFTLRRARDRPKLAELEKCDALAPLYHIEGIGLHIFFQRLPSQFYLAFARLHDGEERVGRGEGEEPAKTGPKPSAATAEISWQAGLVHIG